MRLIASIIVIILFILLVVPQASNDQAKAASGDRIVIQVIQLDYADAEDLASVVAPLLSPEGRVVAYTPTNCLIIKDKASVVNRLVRIIKGPLNR